MIVFLTRQNRTQMRKKNQNHQKRNLRLKQQAQRLEMKEIQ